MIPSEETLPLTLHEKRLFKDILPDAFGMYCRKAHTTPQLCGLWKKLPTPTTSGILIEYQPISSKTGQPVAMRITEQATTNGIRQKERPRMDVPGCPRCSSSGKYVYSQLLADFYTLRSEQLEGFEVHHRDDEPLNCHLDNLILPSVHQNRSLQDRGKRKREYHDCKQFKQKQSRCLH